MNPLHYVTESEIIELTQKLVRVPSDWNEPTYEKAALDLLCKFLDTNSIPYEKQKISKNRYNIIAFFKGDKDGKKILFNGHIDTVPPYEMDFPPYNAFIENGWIYGRGSNDMKGAIAAMIMVLLAFHRSKAEFSGEIIVSVVVGEEEDSIGTKKLIQEGLDVHAAIVGEPSGFDYAIAHRGLEWFELEITGKTAHSGYDDHPINAISKAAKVIHVLEKELGAILQNRTHPYTGRSILNFGKILGGEQPSTVAGTCIIQFDRRYIPGETPESVRQEIETIISKLQAEDKDLQITLRLLAQDEHDPYHHVPLETNLANLIVPIVRSAVRKVTGKEPELTTKRGWTDAGLLSSYGKIPTIVCGPGNIRFSHTKNEGIPISHLVDAVKIYSKIALDFCQSE